MIGLIHDRLRASIRSAAGKKPALTAAMIGGKSVRSAEARQEPGYEAGKKTDGRKIRLAVETYSLVLVVVHDGHLQDHDGFALVLVWIKKRPKRLKVVFADSAQKRTGLPAWANRSLGLMLQAALRPVGAKGFVVLPETRSLNAASLGSPDTVGPSAGTR